MRGYTGIALYQPKFIQNWATVLRVAHNFSADFVCTIGHRYKHNVADTTKAFRHTPVFHFADMADFEAHLPLGAIVVPVEVNAPTPLSRFCHPEQAIYLFGGEDRTLEMDCSGGVRLETNHCLNLAVTAGIVLYDRQTKQAV